MWNGAMPRFTMISGKANTHAHDIFQIPKLNQSFCRACCFADVTWLQQILNYFLSPSLPVCFFILVGSQSRSLARELRALENTLPQWQRKYAQKQPLVASVVRCGLLWSQATQPFWWLTPLRIVGDSWLLQLANTCTVCLQRDLKRMIG